ncbi:MAG TPA: TIR domain-containing protein [Pyrinomonadaceae bacterium]|nr:TIR domain-containing protein [Pyrinomonadaceae bacterium]
MTKPTRKGVFISYSHSDRKWLKLLKQHLDLYVEEHQVSYWDDTNIKPGDDWFQEIETALTTAKAAVLLVSKTFLTSKFIGKHEVPPIREAFQAGELKIFWIPIGFSGYKNTWLVDYQAAHNPEEPLAKMSSWERDKVLVEVCEEIRQVLSDGDAETRAQQPSKMKTRYEVIRCNRGRYLNRLGTFLNAGLKDRPRLPHAYLIFGRMGQSHDTLIERIHREVIKPLADRDSTATLQRGVLHKKSDVRWPDAFGSLDAQREDLQIELCREYTGEMPSDFPATFPADVFSKLPQLSQYRFITVQHTIHLSEGGDSASAVEILTWYLQHYWGDVAKMLEHENGNSGRPQFLIFIKVSYETPGLLERLLPTKKLDKDAVKSELAKIVAQANMNFPCLLLDELQTPAYSEVVRWYVDNDVYDTEQDRLEAAINLYKSHGEQISMAIIERELAKCLS